MVMIDPGSAVPVRVRAPVLLGDGKGETVGVVGVVVSTVTGTFVGNDSFPAGSVAVRVRVVDHSGRAGETSIEYDPDALTVPVQIMVPEALRMVMTSPGVPLPVMVGVVSAVTNGELVSHPTDVGVSGAEGGVVSTVSVVPVRLAQFAGEAVSQEVMVRGVVPSVGAGERGPHS